jgi:hypothetical protein
MRMDTSFEIVNGESPEHRRHCKCILQVLNWYRGYEVRVRKNIRYMSRNFGYTSLFRIERRKKEAPDLEVFYCHFKF